MLTRRAFTNTVSALGVAAALPCAALAQSDEANTFPTDNGQIVIHPVSHASFVMETPGTVIYVDPVGEMADYAEYPEPDLILITHEHGDHFNPDLLFEMVKGLDFKPLFVNPAVYEMTGGSVRLNATALANGESGKYRDVEIEAIPAYNTTEDRLNYHPEGRDNGYILTIDGRRVYIAGDTEDTPEMRALTDIYIAFVPMNLPYTMDITQAASAVSEFKPAYVYPYHYAESDVGKFAEMVAGDTEVRMGAWYD